MLETMNQVIVLITGLCGLITGGVGAFFAIKGFIKAAKEKSLKEIWNMIMVAADAAMTEAERSGANGADKKQMAINIVKETCKSQGIEIDAFIDQLGAYIDQCIKFANGLKK